MTCTRVRVHGDTLSATCHSCVLESLSAGKSILSACLCACCRLAGRAQQIQSSVEKLGQQLVDSSVSGSDATVVEQHGIVDMSQAVSEQLAGLQQLMQAEVAKYQTTFDASIKVCGNMRSAAR